MATSPLLRRQLALPRSRGSCKDDRRQEPPLGSVPPTVEGKGIAFALSPAHLGPSCPQGKGKLGKGLQKLDMTFGQRHGCHNHAHGSSMGGLGDPLQDVCQGRYPVSVLECEFQGFPHSLS